MSASNKKDQPTHNESVTPRDLGERLVASFITEELEVLTSDMVLDALNDTKHQHTKVALQSVARALAMRFTNGEEAARDLRKAARLKKIAGTKEEEKQKSNDWQNTTLVYKMLSFFNLARLTLVRLNRLKKALKLPEFLSKHFAILSLSFFVELAIEFSIIIKSTFFNPLTEKERKENPIARYWRRFTNVVLKDRRPYRLVNAIVWAPINILFFFASPFLFAILNTGGFGFDFVHEVFWLGHLINRYHKINKQLDCLSQENNSDDDKQSIAALKLAVQQKRRDAIINQAYQVLTIGLVFVGMVLISLLVFNPALIAPNAFLIGSAIALVAGSVVGGLGKRFWLDLLWPSIKRTFPNIGNRFKTELVELPTLEQTSTAKLLDKMNPEVNKQTPGEPQQAQDSTSARPLPDPTPGEPLQEAPKEQNTPPSVTKTESQFTIPATPPPTPT